MGAKAQLNRATTQACSGSPDKELRSAWVPLLLPRGTLAPGN